MRIKRNGYSLTIQVVYAIASDVGSISEVEGLSIGSTFRNAAKNLKCGISETSHGDRWFQAMVEVEPGFDIPGAMTSLKAVTSRAMHGQRGGKSGFWAPGYIAVSIGTAVDPEQAAARLGNKSRKQD